MCSNTWAVLELARALHGWCGRAFPEDGQALRWKRSRSRLIGCQGAAQQFGDPPKLRTLTCIPAISCPAIPSLAISRLPCFFVPNSLLHRLLICYEHDHGLLGLADSINLSLNTLQPFTRTSACVAVENPRALTEGPLVVPVRRILATVTQPRLRPHLEIQHPA